VLLVGLPSMMPTDECIKALFWAYDFTWPRLMPWPCLERTARLRRGAMPFLVEYCVRLEVVPTAPWLYLAVILSCVDRSVVPSWGKYSSLVEPSLIPWLSILSLS